MKGMMGKFLTVTLAVLFSNFANAGYVFLSGWGVNVSGDGIGGAEQVDTLIVNGFSYTDSTTDGGGTPVSFDDYGYLESNAYDYGIALNQSLGGTITAIFNDWTGTYTATSASTADYTFTSGTINWYSDADATIDAILTATIVEGSGDINFATVGSGDSNGAVEIVFGIDSVLAGYFFVDTNDDGILDTDLFDILAGLAEGEYLYFNYANTTNSILSEATVPTADVALAEILDVTGATLDTEDTALDIVTKNTGNSGMSVIPEPGMLSLMGLAFLGLAGFQQRRKKA